MSSAFCLVALSNSSPWKTPFVKCPSRVFVTANFLLLYITNNKIPLNKESYGKIETYSSSREESIDPTDLKAVSPLLSPFKVSRSIVPFDNLRLLTLEELTIPRSKEEDVLSRFLQIVWSIRHRVWEFHQGVTRKRKRQGDRERERAWPYPRLPSLSLDPLSEGCTNIKVKFLALSFLLAERDRFNQKKKEWGRRISPIIGVERAHFLSWPLDHVRDIISSLFLSRISSNLHFPCSSGSRRGSSVASIDRKYHITLQIGRFDAK